MNEKPSQRMLLLNRSRLELNGVKNVCGFDENYVRLATNQGDLLIKGGSLNINGLDLEKGELQLSGRVDSLGYFESGSQGGKKLLKRLLK